ncbi:MAG: cyclic pyranopterin phosphate synthase [Verrucomicrobiales bacterium]|jgi:cyclic pyranopterin phosphate synthase
MSDPLKLSHIDASGAASMVDVADKQVTRREAIATATITMEPETVALIAENGLPKGDVLAVARIAGIQAAKQTQHLIPLCHQLPLTFAGVEFELSEAAVVITTTVRTTAQTGVEMEALTAASIAALTVYDMCKAADKGMVISETQLLQKTK